ESYAVANAEIDSKNNKIQYRLARAGGGPLPMGIPRGPLMGPPVDWKPRPPGLNAERWNGKDSSGGVDMRDDNYFLVMIAYFTLPENAIITFSNDKPPYEAYQRGRKNVRPKKENRGRILVSSRPISPHFTQPLAAYRTPKIVVTFSDV